MKKRITIMLLLILNTLFLFEAHAENNGDFTELRLLRQILERDESQLDLARVKLTIDKLIDPSINVEAELSKLNQIVANIKSMLPSEASAMDTMFAVKKYLYTSGSWNEYQAYEYDFNDPLGTNISNKLLSNYMRNKKGNCITMPFLFIIIGDKIGIDVTASIAPLHVLVKFTDSEGKTHNLETTSGANFARDAWYHEQMPMTDQAIENGIYLQPLSRKETVAVMITVLAEYYMQEKEYKKAWAISDLSLKYYPKYVNAMLRNGSAFYRMAQEYFISKYPNPNDIPQNQKETFNFLSKGNRYWFAKAEKLGWREPSRDYEEKYLKTIKRDSLKGGL
ncbi:MAG: hypothetical protein GY820_27070 [Gammaproteobacteria bacterium]|nr:hypothetical protein [Gammaproteobacteria bacterium]